MKRVAVTGATGNVAYSLLFRIGQGDLFGNKEPVSLHLYDIPGTEQHLEGIRMELEDCAFPLIKELSVGTDLYTQFAGVDLALLVGSKPREKGVERGDLLKANGKIFIEQGRALNEVATSKSVVLVVGNPCNTNCLIAMKHAPKIPRKNFHALMRLDHLRATALLAKKAKVPVDKVKGVVVWGNHSATQVPDFTHVKIDNKGVTEVIRDEKWLHEEFFDLVQKRGAAIIAARGKSSAASAAHATIQAVRDIYTPTPKGEWFSSAVFSDDNPYGIEEKLVFGFPCRSKGEGDYEIVPGLEWDFLIKEKIALTQNELLSERACTEQCLV